MATQIKARRSMKMAWELSGLLSEGELERPVAGQWGVPGRIQLDGKWLLSGPRGKSGADLQSKLRDELWVTLPRASHRSRFLDEFVALADLRGARLGQAVVRYARRYGVLRLCEHNLPASHDVACQPRSWLEEEEPRAWWSHREPIEAWSMFAAQARAMLNIAARLRSGQPGSDDDWLVLGSTPSTDPDRPAVSQSQDPEELFLLSSAPKWTDSEREQLRRIIGLDDVERQQLDALRHLDAAQFNLVGSLQTWQRWGGVSPLIAWEGSAKPQYELSGRGLFGALALQLLLAITSQGGYVTCHLCNKPFSPKRRGQRYCVQCHKSGDAHRDVAVKSMQRIRARRSRPATRLEHALRLS